MLNIVGIPWPVSHTRIECGQLIELFSFSWISHAIFWMTPSHFRGGHLDHQTWKCFNISIYNSMFSEYGQYSLTFKNLKSCSFPLENWEKWIFIETTKSQWFGPRSVKVCETAHWLPTMMKSLTCKRVSILILSWCVHVYFERL